MPNNDNYKKLSLYVILDQYVTRNAIIDFLATDHSEFKEALIQSNPKNASKIDEFINDLEKELEEIEVYLNDEENVDWQTLGINKKILDDNLPRYKRRIEWFRAIDRYPFDYSVFFSNQSENYINE